MPVTGQQGNWRQFPGPGKVRAELGRRGSPTLRTVTAMSGVLTFVPVPPCWIEGWREIVKAPPDAWDSGSPSQRPKQLWVTREWMVEGWAPMSRYGATAHLAFNLLSGSCPGHLEDSGRAEPLGLRPMPRLALWTGPKSLTQKSSYPSRVRKGICSGRCSQSGWRGHRSDPRNQPVISLRVNQQFHVLHLLIKCPSS
jgi:hypothetical protein